MSFSMIFIFLVISIFCSLAHVSAIACASKRPVIILGIDGLGADTVTSPSFSSSAPHMYELIRQSAFTTAGQSFSPTLSLPNWSALMLGTSPKSSGILSNDVPFSSQVQTSCTSLFASAHAAGLRTALYSDWAPVFELIVRRDIDDPVYDPSTFKIAHAFIEMLKVKPIPDLSYIHLDSIDLAGHTSGWNSPGFIQAITDLDGMIGTIVETAVASGLDPLFVLVSDHGGEGKSHEISSTIVRTVPIAFWGGSVKVGPCPAILNVADVAATILHTLGLSRPKHWDGRSRRDQILTCGQSEPQTVVESPTCHDVFNPATLFGQSPFKLHV